MLVLINNPITQTWIFSALLAAVFLISARAKIKPNLLPPEVSQELKGLAILMVVFSHVGYYLAKDTSFLFPLSAMGGVGVNLFLLLSGYGLAASGQKKDLAVKQFYQRRLSKLYLPLWLVLTAFFVLDWLVLNKTYDWGYIVRSFVGWFPHANLYTDIDSPLWYFSLIIFYYLLFPIVWLKKQPWLSALIIYAISFLIIWAKFPWMNDIIGMYKVHLIAFPLGILLASLRKYISTPTSPFVPLLVRRGKRAVVMLLLIIVIVYTAIHSGVGEKPWIEESISLITTISFIALFVVSRWQIQALSLIGLFSYEIYLLHWPLMYRYDFLFKFLPAWLALLLYLIVFIGLGWLIKQLIMLKSHTKQPKV